MRHTVSMEEAPTGAKKRTDMAKVLLINAHQFYDGISSGRVNQTMLKTIYEEMDGNGYELRHTNIEQGYDIQAEVDKHLWADIIILQSPVYWFGAPWTYKKYVDEVFTAAMMLGLFITGDGRTRTNPDEQYGTGGLLQGGATCCRSPGMPRPKPSAPHVSNCSAEKPWMTFSSPIPPITGSAAWIFCPPSLATT